MAEPRYCIVLIDEDETILNVIGTFDDYDEAQEYAELLPSNMYTEILELEEPTL